MRNRIISNQSLELRKLTIKLSPSAFPNAKKVFKSKSAYLPPRYALATSTIESTKPPTPKSQQQLGSSPLKIKISNGGKLKTLQALQMKCEWDSDLQPLQVRTARNGDQTTRNEQVTKKRTNKSPIKLTNKFFKKEMGNIMDKLEQMRRPTIKIPIEKPKPRQTNNNYDFKLIKQIGKSQTGDILLVYSNVNKMIVAIKTFKKDKIKLQYLIDQIKIHLFCNHPNILPAYGYHIGRTECYLMMEYGTHNLYQQILKFGPFGQDKAARYIIQIMSAVDYLHRNGIMHRDLKPQNVICFGDHLKLTDFGWSIRSSRMRKTLCGTMDYISPETMLGQPYDNKIDVWSIGVLLYEMLTTRPPFPQNAPSYDFSHLLFPQGTTRSCLDLLHRLLEVEPQKRITAGQALMHPWIISHVKKAKKNEDRAFQDEFDALFDAFH